MDRRVYLRGLINSCPFIDAVKNCPIEPLRRLPIEDLIKKMKSLPDNEVIRITQHHVKCKKEREKTTESEGRVYNINLQQESGDSSKICREFLFT